MSIRNVLNTALDEINLLEDRNNYLCLEVEKLEDFKFKNNVLEIKLKDSYELYEKLEEKYSYLEKSFNQKSLVMNSDTYPYFVNETTVKELLSLMSRALNTLDPQHAPEWAVQLHDQLLMIASHADSKLKIEITNI
jgi:hypothetical protein